MKLPDDPFGGEHRGSALFAELAQLQSANVRGLHAQLERVAETEAALGGGPLEQVHAAIAAFEVVMQAGFGSLYSIAADVAERARGAS